MVKLKTNKTLTKEPRKKNKDLIERKKKYMISCNSMIKLKTNKKFIKKCRDKK